MIENLDDLVSAMSGDDPPVSNQQRQDWNMYVKWLDKRGMKGHPSLDTNNLGKNLLAKYIKENPETSLTTNVIPIQNEFAKYRMWAIDNLRNKKAQINDPKAPGGSRYVAPDENLDEFMKELSIVDNYPGQFTTRHFFPEEYLKTFHDGQLIKTEKVGFATPK